jgi:hypothetical protein
MTLSQRLSRNVASGGTALRFGKQDQAALASIFSGAGNAIC